MKDYNQITTIELTTDQVLLAIATLSASMSEIKAWLESKGKDKESLPEAVARIEETYEDIRELYNVFVVAQQNIEQSWSSKD